MKTRLLIASGLFLAAFATVPPPAHALTAKECSAKYKAAKAAGTLNGMKWNDFRKAECSGEAPAGAPPAAAEKPAAKPAPAAAAEKPMAAPKAAGEKKPVSPGRQAMLNRLHACSADWKAMKAEGKRPAGMKWPQFWHQCDEQKKAAGM
ncbi:MAG: hypothetical protein KGK33_05795 [Hyphomicrobiales bacterium]|nr:hypothetical protein [Hyphomicrobiales bacterium]MDE2284110.1 hypothetical protein [Hyphomicrobiales bacterium]